MKLLKYAVVALLVTGCAKKAETPRAMMENTPQMTPQQMEEAFKKASTPGEKHRALDPLVGSYKVVSKMWMDPAAQPEVAEGSADFKWVLDGHFIEQNYHGAFQGRPFDGKGTFGYNNVENRYESSWVDTMSTGQMQSSGQIDPTGKNLIMSGDYTCPMTGQRMKSKEIFTIGTDKHVFEMYQKTPDGKEFKGLEITYERLPTAKTGAVKKAKKI